MQLYVDDKQVEDEPAVAGTLEDALRHVQDEVCALGRLVIGVRVDGEDVPGDVMVETLKKEVPSVARLDVFTSTKERLVTDAMAQASTSLTETEASAQRVADMLVEGKTTEATKELGQCLHIWQQIHEAVGKSILMLELDPERTTISDEPLSAMISKPKDVLLQVRDALRVSDLVLLADILKYEFAEVTDTWHAIISRIRQAAEDQQGE